MKLWKEKIVIEAPMEHVFKCITDFESLEQFILSRKNGIIEELKDSRVKKFKIQYNKASGELTVVTDYPLFKIVPERKILNEYTSGKLIPLKEPMTRLGEARIECVLTEMNGVTELLTEVTSFRDPNIFWKLFIKLVLLILRLRSNSAMGTFVKFVEKNA